MFNSLKYDLDKKQQQWFQKILKKPKSTFNVYKKYLIIRP